MRARTVCILAALVVRLVVPASAQAPDAYTPLPSIVLPTDLDRVLRDYERAWAAGDEAALATLFTEDGFVPTGRGWVRGRDAIRRTYENSGGSLRLRALAFVVQDTVGYIVGAYGFGANTSDTGKFVLALRRPPGGGWLIAADLDQANRREQPAAAPPGQ